MTSEGAPDWKAELAHDAENFMLVYEGIELGNTDFSAPILSFLPEKYVQPWTNFTSCLKGAETRADGDVCYKALKKDVATAG